MAWGIEINGLQEASIAKTLNCPQGNGIHVSSASESRSIEFHLAQSLDECAASKNKQGSGQRGMRCKPSVFCFNGNYLVFS